METEIGDIAGRIDRFRIDLRTEEPATIFDRHVLKQACYALDQYEEAAIVRRIAAKFSIPRENIVIVGSAKLGFTLVNKSRHGQQRNRYSGFSDGSDVDVAIVSDTLFDHYWKTGYRFHRDKVLWERKEDFRKYLLRGWINPKLLPVSTTDTVARDWATFFNSLTRAGDCGDFPINAAIYRDAHFFQTYHCDTIARLKATEESMQ